MQNIVIDQPYEFVPPHRGTFWYSVLQQVYLRRYLRRTYGIERVECRNHELLAQSIEAGHGVLLTPNHSRDCDPLVLGELARCVGRPFYFMASWHVFMQGKFMAWLLRRSPVMVPIPGTGSVKHLEENMAAAGVTLDEDTYAELEAAGE